MNDTPQIPPLLARITRPSLVAQLSVEEKKILADELRQTIINTVAANGGHLAPSLGVVELTLALLSVFNPDEDKVVWDVGHQSYAWKLLTGRAGAFHTLAPIRRHQRFSQAERKPLRPLRRRPFLDLRFRCVGHGHGPGSCGQAQSCACSHRRRFPHGRPRL